MTTGRHILFWIAGIFAFSLIVPFIASPAQLWGNVTTELAMINSAFGEKDTYRLSKTATEIYDAVFRESGLVDATKRGEVSEKERADSMPLFGGGGQMVTSATNNYVTSLSVMFYVVTLRLLIVLSWVPYIIPFIAAVAVEGWVRRKLKLAAIGSANTVRFSLSMHLLIVILFIPIIYLFLPVAFTPLFMPVWTLVMSVPLVILVANIHPAATA